MENTQNSDADSGSLDRLVRRIPIDFAAIARETGITRGKVCKSTWAGWCVQNHGDGPDLATIEPPPMLLGETEIRIRKGHWCFYAPFDTSEARRCGHEKLFDFPCGIWDCPDCGKAIEVNCDGNEGRCHWCSPQKALPKSAKRPNSTAAREPSMKPKRTKLSGKKLSREDLDKLIAAADRARERVSKHNAISRSDAVSWLDALESERRSIECLEHRALTEERYDILKVLLQADIKLLKAITEDRSASNAEDHA